MTLQLATTVVIGVACTLLIVQIGLLWRILSAAAVLRRQEERVTHLTEALSLLTETTETGFRAMASEIERLADAAPRRRETRVSVARLAAAVQRGKSHAEIAAAEGVSEGEVALRLHLADQRRSRVNDSRRKPRASQGTENGSLWSE